MVELKNRTRKIKFWWHLSKAYFKRYKYWYLGGLITAAFIIITSYKIAPLIFRSNIVTIGFVGNYSLQTVPSSVLALATQPLINAAKDGKPEAALASHWTVSEDGKTYLVFLKDNIKWHDDTPVNAQDIVIAISDVQITALNNKAIEFKLPNPISSFPLALNKPVFKTNSFYGAGQFRIVNIDQKDNIIRKISLVAKDKNLPRVEIKFYPTEVQAINALKIAEIKTASVANAKELENWPNLEVNKSADRSEIITIFFNNEDPLLSSKELRQALNFAINKSNFDGEATHSPISSSNWTYTSATKRYEYNTGKAKELLSKSQVKNPKITLSASQDLQKIAEAIAKDWRDIGIEVELKFEKNIPREFQALLVINKLLPDPDQYSLWHSSQKSTNIAHYKNVKIDKLLEDARVVQDVEKRKELYFDFQKFLTEDSPAAFLYYPYKYQVTYKNAQKLISKLPL